MHRLRIIHETEYFYHEPVSFGRHFAMLRPREGHDLHIEEGQSEAFPKSSVRWLRDIYGNSIAVIDFEEPADRLRVFSDCLVTIYDDEQRKGVVDPSAQSFPFQYGAHEQIEIIPYRVPSYPHDGRAVMDWLTRIYQPGELVPTLDLLNKLNTAIFESFQYVRREEAGVQVPCRTLALGTGSCRDYAVFMMEAARHLGLASRFVTGYILMGEGQHGATHAWTEVYIPGAGWRGFDPTNNKVAGSEHVSVGVAREHEKASPLSGSWSGSSGAFSHMHVSVQVFSQ
ncbi:transglutaminase family protein [Roseimicrobium sp. ORNL1]|uniref:transglutaminase family protein n=1 Tax=Roseimicrobium sp. ORNL1 TaxID=2711231 RepID=UPI0013E0F8A4|nr:transglutaminase family protein [Roseimicrobium sp. ORNL1]QIF05766.1 transglutaminase family protein [Roseimicrobium sp. ORNL1]